MFLNKINPSKPNVGRSHRGWRTAALRSQTLRRKGKKIGCQRQPYLPVLLNTYKPLSIKLGRCTLWKSRLNKYKLQQSTVLYFWTNLICPSPLWDEATVLPRSTNCRLSVTDLEKKKDFPSRRTPSKQIAESGRRLCAASRRRCGACGASVAPYAPRYSFSALAQSSLALLFSTQSSIEPS